MIPAPPERRLPDGFTVRLHDQVRRCHGDVLADTASGARIRLRARSAEMLPGDELRVTDGASAALARVLLDRGLADPVFDSAAESRIDQGPAEAEVTVVVPVKDRAEGLRALLASVPAGMAVVVVDDGSADPRSIAAVAAERGAALVRHRLSRGPAAARNSGLRSVTTPLALFADSDVVLTESLVARLSRHFADPQLAVVGPRILASHQEDPGWISRYETARSSLDLGPRAGRVLPATRVSYLPSATLMVRVDALGDGFAEELRVAEDVDLIWRLTSAGWRVRYDPQATARHDHRIALREWLARKAFYGSGAASLAARHGDLVAPMRITPLPVAALAALVLAGRKGAPIAAAATAGQVLLTARRLPAGPDRLAAAGSLTAMALVATGWQCGSSLTRHHWPLAAAAALRSQRARRAVLIAGIGEGIADYRRTRPNMDPIRYVVAHRLDDLAYGTGLWLGAWRRRSPKALLPVITGLRRPAAAATAGDQVSATSTHSSAATSAASASPAGRTVSSAAALSPSPRATASS